MSQRDRPTVAVDVLGIVSETERPKAGQCLRSERLVKFNRINVTDLDM
jgi:hypothetical protein